MTLGKRSEGNVHRFATHCAIARFARSALVAGLITSPQCRATTDGGAGRGEDATDVTQNAPCRRGWATARWRQSLSGEEKRQVGLPVTVRRAAVPRRGLADAPLGDATMC